MDNKTGRGSDQVHIRFPDGMRSQLKALAKQNGRTLQAEIIQRLEASLNNQFTSFEDMAELFADKVADKLKGQ